MNELFTNAFHADLTGLNFYCFIIFSALFVSVSLCHRSAEQLEDKSLDNDETPTDFTSENWFSSFQSRNDIFFSLDCLYRNVPNVTNHL